ncbi:MAG: hypothetical protein EOO21_05575 [Comamonadaceae bacterium]|nr:MAG: hypothetical protein EOO21_05575 [Comamonadaceae bacterium]
MGRLNWGVAVDSERAAADRTFGTVGHRRTSLSGNFQYLMDRHNSVGGNVSLYQTRYQRTVAGTDLFGAAPSTGGTRSLYGHAFWQTRLGALPRSRFSVTVRRNEAIVLGGLNATGEEVQWEQDWISGRYETLRPELTTTLGYARDESSGNTQRYPTAGLQFRWWVDSSFSVLGNLRYTSRSSNLYTSRGLSGTVTAEKDLGKGWRTGISAHLNQARSAALQTMRKADPDRAEAAIREHFEAGGSAWTDWDERFLEFIEEHRKTGLVYGTVGDGWHFLISPPAKKGMWFCVRERMTGKGELREESVVALSEIAAAKGL